VAHDQNRNPAVAERFDGLDGLELEFGVADRERFVEQQHARTHLERDGKSQSDEHPDE